MNASSPWFNATPIPETDDAFEVGDIVNLIVGGPDMVVTGVCDECGDITVHWIKIDGDVMSDVFPEEALAYAA
ncbi:DUF2158 domain-containing protein [Mesorhizobium sp. M2D.F.Ca.ET.225.01.1.1]|uniref:DUF2158 domain-containing protein n=1 Tax=unclassified Mesorhizobium TaxID=325217 RepID=UPI000FD4A8C9|nr:MULTISPECIES: DUF2158 domain-containing protein [unclassified Mesorhizobium]TGP65437.1 DUF2158 domain-containing protein [Mesorhizobium sp. M2D.F.Ca.ET.226.01.1.1]TGP71916.1 DUF2158 domain-containing protein [Mesorhizobium sp. M2D.F.Ca.ET.225.01.1.1]